MTGGRRRATIIDVGLLANVSAKTVSRVFNDAPHVSAAVKERVQAAARELDYHPNVLAQALVRRRSHLIGLIYERPSASYVVELQRGVLERLQGERYRLVVIPLSSISERPGEVVALARSAALDGVVLAPPASDHPQIVADLEAAGICCARIAPLYDLNIAYSVTTDDVEAASAIAKYVVALGHRAIGVICGDPAHAASKARLIGYTKAFDAAGVVLRPNLIEQGDFTRESGYEAALRLLEQRDRPTAILAQNDDMAVGALMAARDRGVLVPEDLSIIGFDDSEIAQVTSPRITTVHQPVFEMARSAADMVVRQLAGKPVERHREHLSSLVVRESAASPPVRALSNQVHQPVIGDG